jgi:diketogulonate reductase-like aldo/keto reductase
MFSGRSPCLALASARCNCRVRGYSARRATARRPLPSCAARWNSASIHLTVVNLRLMDDAAPGPYFDDQLAAMAAAREDGLIGGIGLSNVTPGHPAARWPAPTSPAYRTC